MCKSIRSLLLLPAILASTTVVRAQTPAANDTSYHVVKSLPIGGEGRWDCVTFDPAAQRLYVPRQTHVQVIDVQTGKLVGDLPDTQGVHDVALVPELNRGFTSNGK